MAKDNVTGEKLSLNDFVADQDGYLQVFVAYESGKPVWFDDLKITHQPALVVQENHYYPFGLNITGIEKEGKPDHRWQFSGKEKETDFGLVWGDHHARRLDLQLGRFVQIDPHAHSYYGWTPYNYVGNNPLLLTDPDGKDWYIDPDGNEVFIKGATGEIDGYVWLGSGEQQYQYSLDEIVVSATQTESEQNMAAAHQLGIYGAQNASISFAVEYALFLDELSDYIPNPKSLLKRAGKWTFKKLRRWVQRKTKKLAKEKSENGRLLFAKRRSRKIKRGRDAQEQLEGLEKAQENAAKNKKKGQKKQSKINKNDKSKQNLDNELGKIDSLDDAKEFDNPDN